MANGNFAYRKVTVTFFALIDGNNIGQEEAIVQNCLALYSSTKKVKIARSKRTVKVEEVTLEDKPKEVKAGLFGRKITEEYPVLDVTVPTELVSGEFKLPDPPVREVEDDYATSQERIAALFLGADRKLREAEEVSDGQT